MAYTKPLPIPTPISEEFWKGTKRHELLIQECEDCHQRIFYPRTHCTRCTSSHLKWKNSSGKGIVYSYTIIRRPAFPSFAQDVPYVFAIIELEEGVRLASNIIGCKPEEVYIGLPVQAVFDDVTSDVTLVKFKPVNA
jgi:hypothetical protein